MRFWFSALLTATALLGSGARALAQNADTETRRHGANVAAGARGPERAAARAGSAPSGRGSKPISVGLLLGYGHDIGEPANPWSIGFGARGGYSLGGVFLGARFVFYLGKTEDVVDPSGNPAEASVNIWELGIEAGYDLRLGLFALRPGVGSGLASVNADNTLSGSESETEIYVAPGLSALFDVTRDMFVGLDGRFQLVFADETAKGLIVLADVGMRF